MRTIELVRYGEAKYDKVNVIWMKTWTGEKAYITLPLEWYQDTQLHPLDAIRAFTDWKPTAMTTFEEMPRMYTEPAKTICLRRVKT